MLKFLTILLILIATTRSTNSLISDNEILVTIPELGSLKGSTGLTAWSGQEFKQFLGIQYAKSPSQKLRFKPPKATDPWHNVKDATKYGRRCPVITTILKLSEDELKEDLEDCLSLCVFTKDLTKKLPVMVYIHGGGFYNGSAEDHPPNYLLERDIVLVVIQYRIGIFGLLSTNTKEIPGNVAVMDAILSLVWVNKYIQYFGGDHNNVTIFGQSAGAALTSLLTISPIVPTNLFQRAILQSGSIFAPWSITKNPLKNAKFVCKKLQCKNCLSKYAIHKCLMEIPASVIVKILKIEPFLSLTLNDYHGILPKMPSELFNDKKETYPIMMGATKHEGSFINTIVYNKIVSLYGDINNVTPRQYFKYLVNCCGKIDSTGLVENLAMKMIFKSNEIDQKNFTELIPQLIDIGSVLSFKSPIVNFVDLNYKKSSKPNYLYTFDYSGELTRFGYEEPTSQYPFNGGVSHSNDNLYLFPYPKYISNEDDRKMSKIMIELWTSFATNGEPSITNGPQILPVKTGSGPYFKINTNVTIADEFLDEFLAATNDPNKNDLIRFMP